MSLFNKKNNKSSEKIVTVNANPATGSVNHDADLAFLALKYIGDGVVIVNGNGIIELMNPAGAKMTGNLDESFTVGLELGLVLNLEAFDGKKLTKEENPILKAVATNQAYHTREFVMMPRDSQKKISLDISVIPTGATGSDMIVTFRDITKELDDERAQSEFISTASHEMRTPVASIEGYLGLALNAQTATIDERARKYLESAKSASQHLGKLFQDLLDVGKLDDKRVRPTMIPMEFNSVVRTIVGRYDEYVRQKNLSLIFGEKKALSHALDQPIYVMADENFLMEVISNLMENAVKYSPSGGKITVNVTSEMDKAALSITDTGVGIPHEDLSHIFQKFYRVDNSATREINGTGLGLYIVKERVEAMNGTVGADSTYGMGSTFTVTLPRISHDEYEKQRVIMENARLAREAKEAQQMADVMNTVKMQANNVGKEGIPNPPVA